MALLCVCGGGGGFRELVYTLIMCNIEKKSSLVFQFSTHFRPVHI